MATLTVDFHQTVGTIKPMHAVGQPPFIGMDFSMSDYLQKAHIPFSRLHDVGGLYGGNRFVDIPNLFRDFSADPSLPESYDFAFTDILITELMQRGIEPFFRLGVTIENYCKIRAYRIDPPADYEKWARICEGVIRHYTEGWANGFHYDIRYWEIWNEPDNEEDPMENPMWRGSAEDYFRLYEVASKYLKAKFPHLKIGGYASCGFYALTDSSTDFGACSSRYSYFIEFFHQFFDYIKAHDCPLDFFSWHSYASDPYDNNRWARYVRETLDAYGYPDAEQTMNEWNCRPDLKGTAKHAALTAAVMLDLQNSPLDSAMFYDARCGMSTYSSMFNCMTYQPLPTYYSFYAFGQLYVRGAQVAISELPKDVYACAAKAEDGYLVLANISDEAVPLELQLQGAGEVTACKIVSDDAVGEDYVFDGVLPANSVVALQIAL